MVGTHPFTSLCFKLCHYCTNFDSNNYRAHVNSMIITIKMSKSKSWRYDCIIIIIAESHTSGRVRFGRNIEEAICENEILIYVRVCMVHVDVAYCWSTIELRVEMRMQYNYNNHVIYSVSRLAFDNLVLSVLVFFSIFFILAQAQILVSD